MDGRRRVVRELLDIRVFTPRVGPHSSARFGLFIAIAASGGAAIGALIDARDEGLIVGVCIGILYIIAAVVWTLVASVRDFVRARDR